MLPHERTLTKLAIAEDAYYKALLASDAANVAASTLDEKTNALVRLGALVAVDATVPAYMWIVDAARRHGATDDEIAGCLIATLPAIGVANVVAATPKLALALGYDVTAALEEHAVAEPE